MRMFMRDGLRVYNYSMAVRLQLIWICACFALMAQTTSNKSLTGNYWYREVLLASDTSQIQTVFGSMTFDGNGGVTGGTYSVDSSGVVTMTDPLRSGATINARLGTNALIGSNTEAGNSVFSIFVAVPAPASAISANALNGTYWIASLEFLNGSLALKRETFFPATANGSGGFGPISVLGEATNLGDRQITQAVSGATYTVNANGSGSITLPFPGSDPSAQLLGGTKTIYIAQDGSFFFGGGTAAGSPGLLIGIRAGAGLNLLKPFWAADLRVEGQNYSGFAGSAFAVDNAHMTWSRRLRTNNGPMDVTDVTPYAVTSDGSGTLLDNRIAVSSNGQLFLGSGLSSADTSRYELFFGVQAPPVSGTGMFLNPQGVFNVFSFAPAGNPIAPGEFINIYGTGLPARTAVPVPFPTNLSGVQLLINNTPAPLYWITATNVYGVVPYSLRGPTATIVLDNNGARSNTITVPVAATAPGIASLAQNGLGAGAITHANGSLVSASSPATRGETVVIYLTGLGAVSPPVADGTGPSGLSSSNSVLAVYFGGISADVSNISFQGLTPGYAGLYQINVKIPQNVSSGAAVALAIQTINGFTDMVDIAIQ
jgi:uncharacterized protein (TIGR03437 family)